MSRFTSPTVVLPRDPRTVEASQVLVSFAMHCQVQAVSECRALDGAVPTRLACDESDIDAVLATLGCEVVL